MTDIFPLHYNKDDIQFYKGLEPVRLWPGMFIGDTGIRGLHHLLFEVIDNAVEEAMAGYCTNIRVTLRHDEVTVEE